jgi:hypothetical protein
MTALLLASLLSLADQRGPTAPPEHPRSLFPEAVAAPNALGALPLDKLLHASISANLVLGVSALAHVAGLPDWLALTLGAGVSLVLGVVREVLGNRDGWDMLANGVGIGAGVATSALLLGGEW